MALITIRAVVMTVVLFLSNVEALPTASPTLSTDNTAFAPTTPGGACLDATDYGLWTGTVGTKSGFEFFPADLNNCTQSCLPEFNATFSTDYQCGGFEELPCPSNLAAICMRDCFNRPTSGPGSTFPFPTISVSGYSQTCAMCMGNLSFCGLTECSSSCIVQSVACQTCVNQTCNPSFETCSGLNPSCTVGPSAAPTILTLSPTTKGSGGVSSSISYSVATMFAVGLIMVMRGDYNVYF